VRLIKRIFIIWYISNKFKPIYDLLSIIL